MCAANRFRCTVYGVSPQEHPAGEARPGGVRQVPVKRVVTIAAVIGVLALVVTACIPDQATGAWQLYGKPEVEREWREPAGARTG